MKKILALIVMLLYTSLNACYAFSELFYLRNASTAEIKPMVENSFSYYDYKLNKADPYYGISRTNSANYAVVILQQSGQDVFYYYQSNENKKTSLFINNV